MFEFITNFFKRIEPQDIKDMSQEDYIDDQDRPAGQPIIKIGEGSYGCVYRPQIQCENGRAGRPGTISKLMSLRHAMAEFKSTQLISRIDRDHIFHYPVVDSCHVAPQPDCPNKRVEYQLVYEDGGNPLTRHITKRVSTHYPDQFLYGLWRLFIGLYALHNNDTYHLDIKPDNIVVKRDREYIIKYLDFGMSKTSTELYFEGEMWPGYPWHPVETLFLSRGVLKTAMDVLSQRGSLVDFLAVLGPQVLYDRVELRVRATGEARAAVETEMRQNLNIILTMYARLYLSNPATADAKLWRFIYTRIDVYSLGVTLLQTSGLVPAIKNIAARMASINIKTRSGPCRALNEYLTLCQHHIDKGQTLQIGNQMIPQERRQRIDECLVDQVVIDRLHGDLSDNM